jgi:hypothetical protein
MPAPRPHIGVKDAEYYRKLGDGFAEQARDADEAKDARFYMLAARDAWTRAAELGDTNTDPAALDAFLNDYLIGGAAG